VGWSAVGWSAVGWSEMMQVWELAMVRAKAVRYRAGLMALEA
jgi:hypothetical protein